MGRSKFPGKPSKSINRKRISVVQLEDEATATTAAPIPTSTSTTSTTTATTRRTSGSTEEEQTQKDAEEKEDSRRVLNNKHVTLTKNTIVETNNDVGGGAEGGRVATKTEKRKNGTGGGRHCSDKNGANEQQRHHEDDDDDSDYNDLSNRQRAITTTTNNSTASSGNKSSGGATNNGNISNVNGKAHGRTANNSHHYQQQHKSHKYLPTTTISIVDDLAEDSQYSSDDDNQHEIDEGTQRHLHEDDDDDDDDNDDDEESEMEENVDNDMNVDSLFPAKQRLCDGNSISTFAISLFGKSKSSSTSSSSYAAAFSPSASSHSSNCSSSSSTSGCGVSRNHHVGSSRWSDGKMKGNNKQQTQRKKFANLNLAKAEVMLPSTSKWRKQQQQQECKEEGTIKNAEVDMDEQHEKLLNCYVSAVSTPTTITSEGSCNLAAAVAVTSALSDCTTTTITTATTGSVLKSAETNTNATTSAVDETAIDSLLPATNVGEVNLATSENKMAMATSMSCTSISTATTTTTTTTITTAPLLSNGMAMCASPSAASTTSTTSNSSSKQKKTVTFKNILETSDDKTAVKKFYNPDNRLPLVSIMKKEAMARHTLYSRHNAIIVRPSRLTEILKNNANIDKLNSLKFRTNPTTTTTTTTSITSATTTLSSASSSSSIFGARTLSRVFGAPDTDDEEENQVAFHPKDTTKVNISSSAEGYNKNHVEDEHEEEESLKHSEEEAEAAEGEIEEEEEEEEEQQDDVEERMIVDKHFVLPKRSTRSSRVIKPNKRLLEDGIICQRKFSSNSATDNNNHSASSNINKIKAKKEQQQQEIDTQKHEEKQTTATTTNYFGLGIKNTKESLVSSTATASSSSSNTSSLAFSLTTSAFSSSFGGLGGISMGNIKANSFVLRQPRLQFDSLSTTTTTTNTAATTTATNTNSFGSSNTFSLNSGSLLNLNTPANCGVCGSVIHSKNMQQSRKYGVPACEVCRKFISKITKKSIAASASPSLSALQLQCKSEIVASANDDAVTKADDSGNDSCNIQAQAKTHMKNFKKIYKERCAACWLKKCLQNLQWSSSSHRQRLLAVLPKRHVEFLQKSTIAQIDTKTGLEIESNKLFTTKWKNPNESTTQTVATTENLKMNLNLKNNPLAENNVTFGSTPLLRPNLVIEKPLFMKTEQVQSVTSEKSEIVKHAKSKRHKEKHHEKVKDKEHKEKSSKEKDIKFCNAITLPTTTATIAETTICTTTTAAATTISDNITVSTIATTTLTTTSVETTTTTSSSSSSSSSKRQRIALKGPRVKHVCRSASIVLGQPLATFGDEEDEDDSLTEEQESEELKENDEAIKSIPVTTTNTSASNDKQFVINENCEQESFMSTEKSFPLQATRATTNNINIQKSHTNMIAINKKYMNTNAQAHQQHTGPIRRKETTGLRNNMKAKPLISIDFWENYDPAEVSQTGFGLIVTEPVAQRALCFLCGSTGMDPLIFCACCCEPYHQYCVLDEYNLKHSSLDDTMVSLLDTSTTVAPSNRLNWLCPRCTVCYTCNMSSGAKVRCQKCQKSYHATCLGTSKRLLGADRPLICVNCLKCKSCSTTKVSKFVGNLPMCTVCFRLRKKGNFCPICQKCYEDNDFDLKMMECGDCQQWVHSKCEGLSDEQYNLLSTLPESIEFICKRCARRHDSSKVRAQEWRQAVSEEFKNSLLTVLKLLSKSRQACVLLKMSPRKKLRCTCGAASNLQNGHAVKALSFNLGSDGESQHSDDVYEFKDKSYNNCVCLENNSYFGNQQLSLVDIKQKIANDTYVSLAEFNYDMNNIIQSTQCDELILSYKEILSEQFPWFQNETKACTDALEDDMFESCSFNMSEDEQNEFACEQQRYNNSAVDLPADLEQIMYAVKNRADNRVCLLCRKTGEGAANAESRLLYCGHDCWVHTNCALWSAEVFEEIDGSLQNVHSAVARGRMIKCTVCGNRGASVGCNVKSCGEHYHYPCARSIDCAFLSDKSMYCPTHASQALKRGSLETNFEVSRPVYVELERKRNRKLVEPSKVQFHIGSLEVKQLGSILPRFSDSYEALIPINFLCSRLYWSYREPWRIVEYTVRTTIQNSFSTLTSYDTGRNFTVDHSNPNTNLVQLGLTQITRWHNSLARGELNDYENSSNFGKLLPEYLNQNSVSAVGADENTEEEPQNNADLLPPEVKDAIFEDLPHELLDGISMLDIFPKFMIYEELGGCGSGSDATKAEFFLGEHSKDGSAGNFAQLSVSDEDTLNSTLGKQLDVYNTSNSASNNTVSHVEDAMLGAMGRVSKQAKLFKNRVPQPRVWTKLDTNSVSAIKRRKLSKCESVLLSLNHQRKKETTTATVAAMARRHSVATDKQNFTWSAAKRYIGGSASSDDAKKLKISQMDGVDDSITEFRIISTDGQFAAGTVKCDRCHCTYRTYDSFQRHLPNCEPLSTSESESEAASHSPDAAGSPVLNGDTLAADFNKLGRANIQANISASNNMPFIQAFPQSISLGNLQANINGIPIATNIQNIGGMQGLQNLQNLQNFQSLQNMQLQGLQSQALGGNFFISQNNATTNTLPEEVTLFANPIQGLTANLNGTYTISTPTTTQAQPQLIAVSTGPDGTPQIIQLPSTMNTSSNLLNNTYQTIGQATNDKKIMQPIISAGKGLKNKNVTPAMSLNARNKVKTNNTVKSIQSKMLPPTPAPITVQLNTTAANNNASQLLNQNLLQQMQAAAVAQPQLLFQTGNAGAQQQPLIMQQPQNIISFVTADGNQNPQVQYVTLPTTNDRQNTPFITTSGAPTMQGAFLQTDASGNIVLTTAPQAAPSLQMLSAQPQVIGTLIQPQTLQLSNNVLTTTGNDTQTAAQQQVIIGTGAGATGLEVLNAANNNAGAPQVILATQPMYYGLETIVQNTVMSSQQFVSNTLPGVLSQNATFSATTTQVFQASKIEPIVDIPTGYVVLNNVDAGATMQQPQGNNQQTTATTQQATFLNTTTTGADLLQHQQHQQQQQQQSIIDQQQAQYIRINTANQNANNGIQYQTTIPQQQQHQQQFVEPMPPTAVASVVTAKIPPVSQVKRNNNANKTSGTATKVQPQQVVNKVLPTTQQQQRMNKQQQSLLNQNKCNNKFTGTTVAATILTSAPQQQQQQQEQQQAYATFTTTIANSDNVTTATAATTTNRKNTNLIRPLNKAEVKPKVIKTNTNKQQKLNNNQQIKLTNMKQQQQIQINNLQMEEQNNNMDLLLQTTIPSIPIQQQQQQQQQQTQQQWQQERQTSYNLVVERQLQNGNIVYEYNTQSEQQHHHQQQQQQQHINFVEQTDNNQFNNTLPATTTTISTTACATATTNRLQFNHNNINNTNTINNNNNNNNVSNLIYNTNVPTNIVNPLQQIVTTTTANVAATNVTTSRPTNRVLPMQQRPDPPVISTHVTAVTGTMAKSVTTTKVRGNIKTYSNNNENINAQIVNTNNNNTSTQKTAYESEVKKDQQMLQIINSTILQENYQQQDAQILPEMYNMQENYEQQQDHESYMNMETDAYKCMQAATSSSPIRCEQLNLIAENLPDFDNDCLLNAKEMNSPEDQAYSDMACDENEIEDDEFADTERDNILQEDDDDDGFSLKIPDADGENDLSDCDEPEVKETICKILDNLTNEDCGDSVVTATTVEATAELNNQTNIAASVGFVQPMNTCQQNNHATQVQVDFENNQMLENEEINAATAAEFISQIDMATVTSNNSMSKCLEPKEKLTEEALECLQDNSNAQASLQPTRKASPPPPLPREARKISGPHLLYEIQSEDGFTYKSTSITEIWEKVFEAVQVARRAHGLAPLPEGPLADMSGVQMLGLKTNALRYLIEQLPGVERCSKYTPKYHKPGTLPTAGTSYAPAIQNLMSSSQLSTNNLNKNLAESLVDYNSDQEELQENLYECARCEPFVKRSEYDMFSWLASRHRKQPVQVFVQPSDTELVPRRGTGSNLPMAMKYRTLKETYKDYVGVFRSQIHGRGLYCTKDIEAGEMVIEYAGELIRSTLTDKRERNYDSRGIGCYMFKIDDNLVVDATMRGNAARFINHSCEPNCYSKVVDILGHKHIIIFALRRIVQGEELTYDYKFPFEEEKIPCSCGSKKCRKYLN